MSAARPPYLPGDPVPAAEIDAMIRVDQAGEYGAVRIYDGQLAVAQLSFWGRGRARDEIRRMAEQEKRHLAGFDHGLIAVLQHLDLLHDSLAEPPAQQVFGRVLEVLLVFLIHDQLP